MGLYIKKLDNGSFGAIVNSSEYDSYTSDSLRSENLYKFVENNNPPFIDLDTKASFEYILSGDTVERVWTLTKKTGEALVQARKEKWFAIRMTRNDLLSKTDYTQLADAPITEAERQEWAIYRQALRDLTLQPNPFEVVFPTSPKGQDLNIKVYRAE